MQVGKRREAERCSRMYRCAVRSAYVVRDAYVVDKKQRYVRRRIILLCILLEIYFRILYLYHHIHIVILGISVIYM